MERTSDASGIDRKNGMMEGTKMMRTYSIYETIYPIVGEPYKEKIGSVEAATERSALNKAAKQFKVDCGGIPARRRHPENFTAI